MSCIKTLLVGLVMGISMAAYSAPETNPLLQEWSGPYGGVPPFDKVKTADFKPALEKSMADYRKEIEAIAKQKDAPTFANTLEAMEKSGETFNRVLAVYSTWGGSMNTPDFQAVQKDFAPKLAAFQDEIIQNEALFKRIETVYNAKDAKLTPEQQRLVQIQYDRFVLRGAKLSAKDKKKVSKLNQKLASLSTQFSQNVLKDEENEYVLIENAKDLEGLPQPLIDGYSAEAEKRGKKGKWAVANTRSSAEPFLTYASNRALREKVFRMWTSRGDNKNSNNNNKLITEILKLRKERAQALGYKTYAHWNLAETMAKEPQVTVDLMMKVWQPAVAQVKKDVADMQAIVDKEKGGFKIAPWDYRFYAEKVRKAKYDLDFNAVKPYLALENIQKAMFWTADELFGLKFTQVNDVPVFNADMTVFKVTDKKGKFIGLWYFDPYARAGKGSGAWMTAYREQYNFGGKNVTTLVSNNSNFVKGKDGEPTLLSWDDSVTMFHEFGHALHGLNSNVNYPSLSGTNVPRDYVEFPSQILENFLPTKEVLKFLVDKNGKKMPKDLIAKMEKAKYFNQGFTTVEFLASAIVDMRAHLADGAVDPVQFEKTVLGEIGMPSEIVMRHRLPAFNHLFTHEGYAAGYYSYLWSQVLEQDAFEAFLEKKGAFDKDVAKRLQQYIFSPGNTMDPTDAYKKFRGRDAKVDALLKSKGFM